MPGLSIPILQEQFDAIPNSRPILMAVSLNDELTGAEVAELILTGAIATETSITGAVETIPGVKVALCLNEEWTGAIVAEPIPTGIEEIDRDHPKSGVEV